MNSTDCVVTESHWSDRTTDTDFLIACHGNRVHVAITAEALDKAPEHQSKYLQFIKTLTAEDYDYETLEDLHDWIIEGGAEQLSLLPHNTWDENPTLADYLSRPTWYFSLSVSEIGRLCLTKDDSRCDRADPIGLPFYGHHEHYAIWPTFEPSQIWIDAEVSSREVGFEDHEHSSPTLADVPTKVHTSDGATYFFKPYGLGDFDRAIQEFASYSKMKSVTGIDDLRISRLHGIVCNDSSKAIYGLLLTYIDARSTTLQCAVQPDTPKSLREKWADEVTCTVARLHESGLIWGDAKPNNVLIDSQDNAWVIDFGGGYTEGWVDEELMDTKAGDLQGLSRIIEFVFAEEASLPLCENSISTDKE